MADIEIKPPPCLEIDSNLRTNWKKFKESYKLFSIIKKVDKEEKPIQAAILLNFLGSDILELLKTLTKTEADLQDPAKIQELLDQYVSPRTNITFSRYLFNTRQQQEAEIFTDYLLSLRKLAEDCDFQKVTPDQLLRDRIIIGIRDQSLRERLLGDSMELEKVVTLCQSVEAGRGRAKEVSNGNGNNGAIAVHAAKYYKGTTSIKRNNNHNHQTHKTHHHQDTRSSTYAEKHTSSQHHLNNKENSSTSKENRWQKETNQCECCKAKPKKSSKPCGRCGTTHEFGKCPAYGKDCKNCGKPNHFSQMCKIKKCQALNVSNDSLNDSDLNLDLFEDDIVSISNLDYKNTAKDAVIEVKEQGEFWFENVTMNEKTVRFKIDTAAGCNVLPYSIYCQVSEKPLVRSDKIIEAYGGEVLKPLGAATLECIVNSSRQTISFLVVDCTSVPILGLKTCRRLQLVARPQKCKVFDTKESNNDHLEFKDEKDFLHQYKDLFDNSVIGQFPDAQSIEVDAEALPPNKPPRRLPRYV